MVMRFDSAGGGMDAAQARYAQTIIQASPRQVATNWGSEHGATVTRLDAHPKLGPSGGRKPTVQQPHPPTTYPEGQSVERMASSPPHAATARAITGMYLVIMKQMLARASGGQDQEGLPHQQ